MSKYEMLSGDSYDTFDIVRINEDDSIDSVCEVYGLEDAELILRLLIRNEENGNVRSMG